MIFFGVICLSDKIDEMLDKINNGSAEENRQLAEKLSRGLSSEQKKAVERLLSDSNLMKKLSENEKVREIIKKFGGDVNGHQ